MYSVWFSGLAFVKKWRNPELVKVNCAVDTGKVLADFPGSSGAGMALQSYIQLWAKGTRLPTLTLTNHWKRSTPRDWAWSWGSWIFLAFGNSWTWIQLLTTNIPGGWENECLVLKLESGVMDDSICYRIEHTGKNCNSLGTGGFFSALFALSWAWEFECSFVQPNLLSGLLLILSLN